MRLIHTSFLFLKTNLCSKNLAALTSDLDRRILLQEVANPLDEASNSLVLFRTPRQVANSLHSLADSMMLLPVSLKFGIWATVRSGKLSSIQASQL